MFTNTIKKRIALVALSALGTGLLSVVSVPVAHSATVSDSASNTAYAANKLYVANKTAATAVAAATLASNVSQGLYTYVESSGGTDQTAIMRSTGVLALLMGAPTTANQIVVSGGTLSAGVGAGGTTTVTTNAAGTPAGALAATAMYSAASTSLSALWTPGAAGTYTIKLYTGAAVDGTFASLTQGTNVSTVTVTVLNVGELAIEANGSAAFGGTSTTCLPDTNDNTSKGLIVQAGTGTGKTAVMLASGSLSVFVPATAAATNDLVVVGGTIVSATGTSAPTLSSNFTKVTGSAAGDSVCASIIPSGVGTMYIYSYSGLSSASAPVGVATVTVTAAGVSGVASVSNSVVVFNDAASTNVTLPAPAVDSLTGGTIAFGSSASIFVRAIDAYKVPINATTAIVQATNGALAKWDSAFPTSPVEAIARDWTSVNHYVGVKANGAKSTVVTITIDGVVLASKTINFLGDIAKLEVTVGGVQSTGTAGGTAWASSTTLGSLLSFKLKDADGNLVPVGATAVSFKDGGNSFVSTATISQAQDATRVALGKGGYGYWVCSGVEGTASIRLTTKNSLGVSVDSAAVTVKCAADHATYTISTDKASYKTGDLATVTVTFKTLAGTVPNDQQNMAQGYAAGTTTACTASGANTPTLTSAAFKSLVVAPSCGDQTTNGVITYKAVIDQTAGNFQVAYVAPAIDALANGGKAQTTSVTVAGDGSVSNAQVLQSIVALIASINKQIQALQALILKKK